MEPPQRYKGRFITAKQHEKRLRAIQRGQSNRKRVSENDAEEEPEAKQRILEGRRIVEIEVMAQHLYCSFCKEILSLEDIIEEKRHGLASILILRCRQCLQLNSVPTGKQHKVPSANQASRQISLFDINTKATAGVIHSGLGYTSMNKFLQVMNIPCMSSRTFKKHEREIGPVAECEAKDACRDACEEEREFTISNLDVLHKRLPEAIGANFFTPDRRDSEKLHLFSLEGSSLDLTDGSTHSLQPSVDDRNSSCLNESDLSMSTEYPVIDPLKVTETQSNVQLSKVDGNNNERIRIFAGYDMGWTTRGSGFQYDSLSGVGHIVSVHNGKVLDYETRNRKCRLCEAGNAKNSHDCRQNYWGTAKAMEPDVAVQLITQSSILEEKNMGVGVFVADNDSSSICSIRKQSKETVLKQSDKNHTSKGVKSLLYRLDKNKDPDKEMNSETINYLHKCFTYALSQNQGNSKSMAAAIKNIPFHAFNDHKACGDWCGYLKDNENYQHRAIHGGLQNLILFKELKSIFEKLSNNADSFVAGASTQTNESLNHMICSKAPKTQCYGTSESYDYRVACAVAQKNKGEQYIQNIMQRHNLSPGSFLSKHIERVNKSAKIRAHRITTPKFKLNRIRLKQKRSQLKNKRENMEGLTYESNIGLLSIPSTSGIDQPSLDLPVSSNDNNALAVIYFDLETGGFCMNDDILQIALKYGDSVFNKYIKPTRKINPKASGVNGLTCESGDLYLRGIKVQSAPIRIVLGELLIYLHNIRKLCVLVAHNCDFDAQRLLFRIKEASLIDEFNKVIAGFKDSLPLFKMRFPEKESFKLTSLGQELLNLSVNGAHDAIVDVVILEKLINHHFTYNDLVDNVKTVDSVINYMHEQKESKKYLKTLKPFDGYLSKMILKRIADAHINFNSFIDTYQRGEKDLIDLLEKRVDGKAQLIKSKKTLESILEFFKKLLILVTND